MVPYKFLDIENHLDITKQLEHLMLNELYLNILPNNDVLFTFNPTRPGQRKYDVLEHGLLWNYLNHQELFERCPDLKTALDKLGVEAIACSVLVITAGDGTGFRLGLHSDASISDIDYRINWPIYQCLPGTTTTMYKMKPDAVNLLTTGETPYKPPSQDVVPKNETGIYRMSDVESEITSFVFDRPLLFKYNIPHRVYDTEPGVPYPRILLSLDFNDCDLVRELYKTN